MLGMCFGYKCLDNIINAAIKRAAFESQTYLVATLRQNVERGDETRHKIAATSDKISALAGHCSHQDHLDSMAKDYQMVLLSALSAEYPSKLIEAIMEVVANWMIPHTKDTFKAVRQVWIKRILDNNLHLTFTHARTNNQANPFIKDEDILPSTEDLRTCFPSYSFNEAIIPFQPFRLDLFHTLFTISADPDHSIVQLLQEGIPSGAFSPLEPISLWEPNAKNPDELPELKVCQNNWSRANSNPEITRSFIAQEVENNFVEETKDIPRAEEIWPKGIALGKLGVVCADNRDPRLVLDSTIWGMNGRCHLPEKQHLPNLRHVSGFFSTCPPLQEQWQGASIDIKAAHKRMRIKEEESGALLFQYEKKTYAYRCAHFGTSEQKQSSSLLSVFARRAAPSRFRRTF